MLHTSFLVNITDLLKIIRNTRLLSSLLLYLLQIILIKMLVM